MTLPRRVLLLGASGRLGSAIAKNIASPPATRLAARDPARAHIATSESARTIELLAPSREAIALDVEKPLESATRWLETWKPEIVVNCIAMSDVDRCESERLQAMRINAELPGALAKAARRHRAHLFHFSTDFVFDGKLRRPCRESDAPAPLSVYGESKLFGEKAIAGENPSHWIFRISWLYGGSQRNLAAALLDPANAGRAIALASDRVGVPNPVQLLAGEVVHAVGRVKEPQSPVSGVYHLSCRGRTTWHDFGREFIAQAVGAGLLRAEDAPRIEAMNERNTDRPAKRPPWSVLDPSRYESAFARRLPDWRDAIVFALRQEG